MGKVTDSTELLPDLARSLGHLLWRCAAKVGQSVSDTLPEGVDLHGYSVLLALSDGAPRSQQSLAETTSVSRTTMTRVAGDLAAEGLVTRVRNPGDRRSYALSRTEAGVRAAEEWRAHVERTEAALTPSFTATRRDRLRSLLLRIAEPDLAPDTPEPLRTSTGFLITRVHQRAHREFGEMLEPVGLEPRFLGSLIALTALGPASQAELARVLGMTGASMVPIVDLMESRGLVERRSLDGDRRTYVLHLTRRARAALAKARHLAVGGGAPCLQVLTDDERDELIALLVQLITAV
ncbi:hypothetical protein GCM10011519_19850 [Marmoricola endophyticus]|uniref:HTH marR-type domain-containing protein n=1 Tax=Marmoricola endophyticus TaxID=2040280 RepID=A0A917F3U3_9ACTN|nr:hypothetical protein GCM10011519_19850 [Marmoricola endophyticus]